MIWLSAAVSNVLAFEPFLLLYSSWNSFFCDRSFIIPFFVSADDALR